MGPNPNGPRSESCDQAIRYSGFFGVRSVGPTVGDFLDDPHFSSESNIAMGGFGFSDSRNLAKNNWTTEVRGICPRPPILASQSLPNLKCVERLIWLVVSTHLKNISQIGNLPQLGVKIKNVWNHHLVMYITRMSEDMKTNDTNLESMRTTHHWVFNYSKSNQRLEKSGKLSLPQNFLISELLVDTVSKCSIFMEYTKIPPLKVKVYIQGLPFSLLNWKTAGKCEAHSWAHIQHPKAPHLLDSG